MSQEPLMNDKIIEQILTIRDSGVTNMFDVKHVQREAYRKGYYELAVFSRNIVRNTQNLF